MKSQKELGNSKKSVEYFIRYCGQCRVDKQPSKLPMIRQKNFLFGDMNEVL